MQQFSSSVGSEEVSKTRKLRLTKNVANQEKADLIKPLTRLKSNHEE